MATSTASREQASAGSVFEVPADARSVLAGARAEREAADAAEARLLQAACAWADLHPVESIDEASTWRSRGFGDTGVPVAGPGAPWVAEFSIAEFAAAIGLSTDAGRLVIADSLELRHRLPRVWARLVAGDLPAWKARRIASQTQALSMEAATWVDAQVAPFAHKVRPWQVDRLVDAAVARFMPEEADRRRRSAADGRCFDVDHDQVSFNGTSQVRGVLDLADAIDLDAAIAARAEQLKTLGSTESLDVRRAIAAGELARADLALDLNTANDNDGDHDGDGDGDGDRTSDAESTGSGTSRHSARRSRANRRRTREVVLYAHLSRDAITGTGSSGGCRCGATQNAEAGDRGAGRGVDPVAWLENARALITREQVAAWCGIDPTRVVVKPVIDLADRTVHDTETVPPDLSEQVTVRDGTCVFPCCTRPARRCDKDHTVAAAAGGPTESGNLGGTCRRHHRLKTHGSWTVTSPALGVFVWRSRYGYRYLRDATGTLDITDWPQEWIDQLAEPQPDPRPGHQADPPHE